MYKLRDYQQKASDSAVSFFNNKAKKSNAIMVLPTGSGKSLIIADIANRLDGHTLVFQPSKEILEQNFKKLCSYGVLDCSIYSASFNSKEISRITFATIGSVKGHPELFAHFKNVIIDECFTYKQFISTERGKMRIGYIHKLYQDGKELPRVLSYNEKTGKLEPNRILCAKNTGEKRFYKLKFNESFTVKTTLNHPFLTLNGWTEAKDLKIGDAVLSAYPKGSHLQIPNKDQVDFLCGSIVGDGSVDKSRKTINVNRFRFIQGEQQKEYLEWKANMLGCKSKIERIENNGFSKKAAYRFTSPVMYAKDYMCTKKYAIENLNAKSLAVIYMDDGSLSKAQNGATIYSVAESKELTSLFADKLNSFGIDCSARLTTSPSTGRECSYIQIRSEGVKVLCSIIAPFVHKSMSYKLIDEYRQKAGSYDWDNRFGNFGCSVFLGKEYFGKEMAYNIEVEDANTYVVSSARYDKNHKDFDNGLIVHNCHLVNPKEGMYKDFLSILKCKVLGLTATPYRLSSSQDFGSMLKFITRTRPAIFKEVIYHVQVSTLLDMGYLAKLNYYPMNPIGWNELNLKVNTTGADYTDKSVQREYERIDFYGYLVHIVQRLMNPIQGGKRKGILVFTRFLKEAERLTMSIPGCAIVSGDTPKKEREQILEAFKSGEIPVVANVGVLVCGFDYPELDTIVLARPTMSLALYYQIVGRAIRPHKDKEAAWFVDLCGNINRFGKVEDLRLVDSGNNKWAVWNKNKQLTNVYFQ